MLYRIAGSVNLTWPQVGAPACLPYWCAQNIAVHLHRMVFCDLQYETFLPCQWILRQNIQEVCLRP